MLKILYFSGSYQLFKISLGIKSLYFLVEKFIHWPGRHSLRPKRKCQQVYQPGKPMGCISLGHLGMVCVGIWYAMYQSIYLKNVYIFVSIYRIYIKSKGKIFESALKTVLTRAIWIGIGIWYAAYQFIYLKKSEICISIWHYKSKLNQSSAATWSYNTKQE